MVQLAASSTSQSPNLPSRSVPWMRATVAEIRASGSIAPSTLPCGETKTSTLAAVRQSKLDHRGIAGMLGQPIVVEAGAGIGAQRRRQLPVRRDRALGAEAAIGPLLPAVDLRLEQIDRAGHRQDEDEGQHEQPGIEMPAPDGGIESALGGRRGRRGGSVPWMSPFVPQAAVDGTADAGVEDFRGGVGDAGHGHGRNVEISLHVVFPWILGRVASASRQDHV